MKNTSSHRRPGQLRLLWERIVLVFWKEKGEFRLEIMLKEAHDAADYQYEMAVAAIHGQDLYRQEIRALEAEVLTLSLENADLKAQLEVALRANEQNRLKYSDATIREATITAKLPDSVRMSDERTMPEINVEEIIKAVDPVPSRKTITVVPLSKSPQSTPFG